MRHNMASFEWERCRDKKSSDYRYILGIMDCIIEERECKELR